MTFIFRAALLIFLYGVLWQFASLFEINNLVSAFYPAAGVLFYFIYRFGPAYIPISAIAILLGASPIDPFWEWGAIQITMGIRQLFFYTCLALILRKIPAFSLPLIRLSSVAILLGSVFVTTILSALAAMMLMSHYLALDPNERLNTFVSFWIGDLGGVLMFIAAVSLFLDFFEKENSYEDIFDSGLLRPVMLLMLISSATTLLFVLTGLQAEISRFGYLILLPVAWAASFYGIRFALFAALCVNTTAVSHYILLGLDTYPAIELQTLFSVNLGMAMLLGASLEERRLAMFDAAHDPLTQMLNRRAFYQQGQALLERCKRQDRELAMLMIDLDYFKRVNDVWGHQAGDNVLMKVAECCRKVCRHTDIQGRIGGEEFVLLLDDATPEQAFAVAERLRVMVEKVLIPKTNEHISTSIGLSHLIEKEDSLEDLLKQADLALYQAKEAGRNNCRSTVVNPRTLVVESAPV